MKKVLFMVVIFILFVGGCRKEQLPTPTLPQLINDYGYVISDSIADVLSGHIYWLMSFCDYNVYTHHITFYWGDGTDTLVEYKWIFYCRDYGGVASHKWFIARGTTTCQFNVTARAFDEDRYAPSELSKPLIVRVHKDTLGK